MKFGVLAFSVCDVKFVAGFSILSLAPLDDSFKPPAPEFDRLQEPKLLPRNLLGNRARVLLLCPRSNPVDHL